MDKDLNVSGQVVGETSASRTPYLSLDMAMRSHAKPPTKADIRRFALLYDLGCCVCGTKPCELHHFTRNNKRLGHDWTVPLCPPHHTGTEFSWHKTRRVFRDKMGSDAELLARVNGLIGIEE